MKFKCTCVNNAGVCVDCMQEFIENIPEWVPVKKKYPPNEIPVLCWRFGSHPFTASYYEGRFWTNSTTCLLKDCVTHWMPTPEPPSV